MTRIKEIQNGTWTYSTGTDPINPEAVKRVYSGRPGCGCGCRGRYSDEPKTIRLIVKKMNAARRRPSTRPTTGTRRRVTNRPGRPG